MKMICELSEFCYSKFNTHCHPHNDMRQCENTCNKNTKNIECKCVPYDLKHKMMKVIKNENDM
jgi:hypothetical protein